MRSAADRARLLTRRVVTFLALLAGGLLVFTLLAGPDADTTVTTTAPEERGYYLVDATLTELAVNGKPRVIVRAREIEQQLADQSVLLQHLELDYTTTRAGVWHATADHGLMPSNRTSLLLTGNVRVAGSPESSGARALILTDELTYDTKSSVILTSAPVSVQFGTHRLQGRGLRVALNDGTLRLESGVNGTFTP